MNNTCNAWNLQKYWAVTIADYEASSLETLLDRYVREVFLRAGKGPSPRSDAEAITVMVKMEVREGRTHD